MEKRKDPIVLVVGAVFHVIAIIWTVKSFGWELLGVLSLFKWA